MALWLAAIAVALLGLAAAAVGWRGRRVNEHPICRGCRFNLVGLEGVMGDGGQGGTDLRAGQWHGRCPECGRDLGRRRAVRQGERRRRRVVLAAGVVVFLGGAVWMGALVWGRAQGFDWNSVKPTWLLVMETRQPAGHNADVGMKELLKRLEAGALRPAAISTIVEQILEGQGDEEALWHESWGDFVEKAHAKVGLTPAQLERYGRQAIAGAFGAGDFRYHNGSLAYPLVLTRPRAGGGYGWWLRPQLLSLTVGATEVAVPPHCGTFAIGRRGKATAMPSIATALPAGDHDVRIQFRFEMFYPDFQGEPVASWDGEVTTSVSVEPGARVTAVAGPVAAPVPVQQRPIDFARAWPTASGVRVSSTLYFDSVPVGVVADVFWRAGEQEWKVGRVQLEPRFVGGSGFMPGGIVLPGFDQRRVDIVLRSVPAEQADANWPREIWDGELVIPDVEVNWAGGGP